MSNETKWTPGPWTVEPKDGSSGCGINGAGGEAVVWWPHHEDPQNGIEREADAHLIAAAPELYEGLEKCFQLLSDGEGAWTVEDQRKARAALAKARGETQ